MNGWSLEWGEAWMEFSISFLYILRTPLYILWVFIFPPQNPSTPLREWNKVGKPGPATGDLKGAWCPSKFSAPLNLWTWVSVCGDSSVCKNNFGLWGHRPRGRGNLGQQPVTLKGHHAPVNSPHRSICGHGFRSVRTVSVCEDTIAVRLMILLSVMGWFLQVFYFSFFVLCEHI